MSQPNAAHNIVARPGVDTVFRVFSSLIFIVAAINHLLKPAGVAGRLGETRLGSLLTSLIPGEPLVILTGIVMLMAGLMLAVGLKTRVAALVLLSCLIPITVTVQLEPGAYGPLFKNVSIFGSLIYIAAHGPLGFGFDERRSA